MNGFTLLLLYVSIQHSFLNMQLDLLTTNVAVSFKDAAHTLIAKRELNVSIDKITCLILQKQPLSVEDYYYQFTINDIGNCSQNLKSIFSLLDSYEDRSTYTMEGIGAYLFFCKLNKAFNDKKCIGDAEKMISKLDASTASLEGCQRFTI